MRCTLRMWTLATPAQTLAARVLLLAAATSALAVPTQASVPATMSYQGVLRDAGGTIPPDGEYAFVFRLYNIATGGTPLWQESQDLLVTGGLFNATLGAVTPLSLPFDGQYWLETAVDGSTLSPRVQLASAPYAQRAAVAEALVGGGSAGDITAVYADNGLAGGATSGDAHVAVGAGTGISVTADAVAVDGAAVAGAGLVAEGASAVAINPGTGLAVAADQVRLADSYATGTAYDARFVNEGQAGSVTADMVVPNVVASVDGVVNDGGNIDLIAGPNVTITPDDASNTITIAAAGGGGGIGGSGTVAYVPQFTGSTTLGNSSIYQETDSDVAIGTTDTPARLTVQTYSGHEGLRVRSSGNPELALESVDNGSSSWLEFMRGGLVRSHLMEGSDGLYLLRNGAESGGIVMASGTTDAIRSSAVLALYNGSFVSDYVGIHGESAPADYYGIGGNFKGGWVGAKGVVNPTGSQGYIGLWGEVQGGSGVNIGVRGSAMDGLTNYGVYGIAWGGAGYAGYFEGSVHVTGNLTVGGSKAFRIDHPLDPANQYLNHFCIESDEVLNTYSGNVVLDAAGEGWVELAGWFDAVNRDPRYQLTCIGGHAPVYVAEEVSGNRFKIAGGNPGLKVSWEVTAVRSDPSIEMHRLPVEQEKPAPERGKYLEPELYGAPDTQRIGRIEEKVDHR